MKLIEYGHHFLHLLFCQFNWLAVLLQCMTWQIVLHIIHIMSLQFCYTYLCVARYALCRSPFKESTICKPLFTLVTQGERNIEEDEYNTGKITLIVTFVFISKW